MAYIDKYKPYRKDLNFIQKYMKSVNAASGSEVDANSNVSNKNIATMSPEIHKKENIYANRLWMHDRISEMYGEELADEYLRQLEEHEIYRHDETLPIGFPYCASITLYPFIVNGMKGVGGTSKPPKHLRSFLGGFINLVFAVASELCGAVATPEFLAYFDYFVRKEYGNDYYLNTDQVVNNITNETIMDVITQGFEQVVYSLNQPAGARGFQSVFWNVAYLDKPYFTSLFDGFVFPDGTLMQWESVSWLQKTFMKWFNAERLKSILTFPVETVSLLNNGKEFVDKEWADFVAEMYAEGHSFFTYTSDSVDSLASCCYSNDTNVLIKDANGAYLVPFKDIPTMKFNSNGYKIFNNGKWSKGKLIELPPTTMYKVILSNGAEMKLTYNHRNNCLAGTKLTKDLTTDDYIMMNTACLDTYKEADEHLTYAQGFAIGAFLGDGSLGTEMVLSDGTRQIYEVNYSLSKNKAWIADLIKQADIDFGGNGLIRFDKEYNNVMPLRISSKNLVASIMRWTNWKRGVHAENKRLNIDCVLQSVEFRKGIVDGWFATDGNMNSLKSGISLRGYSTSNGLIKDMQAVCTTLGYVTSKSIDTRTQKPIFRNVEYNKNYPVYCLLKYAEYKQAKLSKDKCIFKDNSYWMKVKSIELIENKENVFCFEMEDEADDKFTLPNGIHNFNCRLRNGISENTFSYTLGAGGIATGSKCVMTININRLVQNVMRNDSGRSVNYDLSKISDAISVQVEKIHKYLLAFNSILMDMKNSHMIPIYDSGFVTPDKQYLTIGVNGMVEAAEFLGIEISDNEQYKKFVHAVLTPIYEANKKAKTNEIMFNTEFVPSLLKCGNVKSSLIDLELSERRQQGASVMVA